MACDLRQVRTDELRNRSVVFARDQDRDGLSTGVEDHADVPDVRGYLTLARNDELSDETCRCGFERAVVVLDESLVVRAQGGHRLAVGRVRKGDAPACEDGVLEYEVAGSVE